MPSYQFDYSVFHNAKAPVIPVEFWGKGRWHHLWMYVDSGASFTVLHNYEARRLGVDLTRCRKLMIVSAGDRRLPVYLKRIRLRIGRVVVSTEVGFCRDLGGVFNILGRKDVFETFRVTFDDREQTVGFTAPRGKRRSNP